MSDCRLFGERGTATSSELPFMQSRKIVSSTYYFGNPSPQPDDVWSSKCGG